MIDLSKIIEDRQLDKTEVADRLFPEHKHPKMALGRVLVGEGDLDASQISLFSLYSGIPIAELYTGGGWVSTLGESTHTLTCGEFTAELDSKTWTTKLFKNGSVFHQFILSSKSISLEEYIHMLDSEISKNK